MTYTYVIMEVSASTYHEIAEKMRNAEYDHVFAEDGAIDMHGIAIKLPEQPLMDLIVTELRQTCGACPTRWEGKLKDGRNILVRYRWGTLTVYIFSADQTVDDVWEEPGPVFKKQIGDDLDGSIQWQDVEHYTGLFKP